MERRVADDTDLAAQLRDRLLRLQPDLSKWSRYYEGRQGLSYMAPELIREMEGRIQPVIVNWPRLVVDSLEERLDVEGFRIDQRVEDRLWDFWQANGLDEASQQAHVDALAMRRSYVIVGANDSSDTPLITVESAAQVYADRDPRTRQVTKAIKRWTDDDDNEFLTLYLPDRTVYLVTEYNGRVTREYDTDVHNLGVVPVVPIVNRSRITDNDGVSELADVVPLSDAACKIATDMMISAEFHAMPRRVVVGMGEDDQFDQNGRPLSKWAQIAGRIWTIDALPSEVNVQQFNEANLANFHQTLNTLARMVASMSGLPPHFLGYSDANPTSADAIRSAETRLVKRAERRQRAFGGAWEQVMRLALLVADNTLPEGIDSLETIWRDASTPTVAQKADAAVKLRTAGLISLRQAREDLGYTQEQIAVMEADDTKAVDRVLAGDFTSLLGPKPAPVTEPAATDVP
ncbi:MAG: phage portal protein [Tetrasphaera sp.]|nr:phage portal protein [Tetrasphaera sp.]